MHPREVRQKELMNNPWGSWKRSWYSLGFRLEAILTFRPEKFTKHKLLPFAKREQLSQLSLKQAEILAALANLEWMIIRPGPSYNPSRPPGWSHAEICKQSGRDTKEGLRDHLANLQNMGMI